MNAAANRSRPHLGAGLPASNQVAFAEVLRFVADLGVDPTRVLTAGTPAWCELPDDHPDKLAAVLAAGVHHALRVDLAQAARAEASRAVSASTDWSRVGRPRPDSYIERISA
ncbi:DUF2742 domain-containing protein [Mycolicibacterium brumae]|uniref:DUF2742 domain-containing protein n=1 Tax=Mycolicibacterium brumae TaxID=85968 RepID=UPI000AAD51AE|nr:DUF2742 domain-containing protein [Mycolicibacterium brumae]RWA15750.1 hypothetical protein MBRU_09365 [Mycolicibacterium brumae DSM 44177]UWW07177.1 DUF2742 domain-containing protein [Mycolicibacterium brumae]